MVIEWDVDGDINGIYPTALIWYLCLWLKLGGELKDNNFNGESA